MAVQRKVFRVEEAQLGMIAAAAKAVAAGGMPIAAEAAAGAAAPEAADRHREVMRELAALRVLLQSQMPAAAPSEYDLKALAEARALKQELHTIYESIKRTKQEIATLHLTGFQGPQMARVTDELDAVVVGTERATQTILKAAEDIDENAGNLVASVKNEQDQGAAQDIQDRVIQIFEACNFQDLTGQRISKVVASLRFIESHVMRMIDIWGGLDAFREFEPEAVAEREGDAKLLNGPKLDKEDEGHASQGDIDALFN